MKSPFNLTEEITNSVRFDPYLLVQVQFDPITNTILVPRSISAATSREGRKAFSEDPLQYRWAAAGALLVINCEDGAIAPLRWRDNDAPNPKNKLTLGSGLSSNINHLANPISLAVEEAFQEFFIAVRDRGVVRPFFPGGHETLNRSMWRVVEGGRKTFAAHLGDRTSSSSVPAPSRFLPTSLDQQLTIKTETGVSQTFNGIIVVDEETRGIDLIKVIQVDLLSDRRSELMIFDGEDINGVPINGPVTCLEVVNGILTDNLYGVFENGVRTDKQPPTWDMTPVTEAVKNAIGLRDDF